MAKQDLIWVVPGNNRQVGFHEANPAHPGGEAWVAGDAGSDKKPEPVQIARTSAASLAISKGRIREVSAPAKEEKPVRRSRKSKSEPEPEDEPEAE